MKTETTEKPKSSDKGDALVSLDDCLVEINNALDWWYPCEGEDTQEEHHERHTRLFQFRNKLERQMQANVTHHPERAEQAIG